MTRPKVPTGLGAEGRRVWRAITTDAVDQGIEFDARELEWLRRAAQLADQVAMFDAALLDAPLMTRGSQGQDVANPLFAERRQHVQLLTQVLGRIKTEVPEAGGFATGNQHRHAANARWRGRRAV